MAVIKSPTQRREEQARGLISLLNNIKAIVDEDKANLNKALVQLNSVLGRFYDCNDTQLVEAKRLKTNIMILIMKKCNSTSDPRCNIHDIIVDTKSLIDGIIAEVRALGIPESRTTLDKSMNVNTTVTQNQEQNQNQQQQQEVIVKIMLEAAKDELTGKQRKELLAIVEETKDPQEAHKSILAKLKEFGENVTANIVANIMTNPQVWSNMGSIL